MSIIVRGTMRIETKPVIENTRLSQMTIEISHEHYDQWNKVFYGGDWKSRTELLEYCLYVGLAQLEKRMKENKKLDVEEDLDGCAVIE